MSGVWVGDESVVQLTHTGRGTPLDQTPQKLNEIVCAWTFVALTECLAKRVRWPRSARRAHDVLHGLPRLLTGSITDVLLSVVRK